MPWIFNVFTGKFDYYAYGDLDDLADVNIAAPAGNDLIYWNAVAGEWQSRSVPANLNVVLTTRGDVLRRGAALPERYAIGAANRFLRSDGVDPVWDWTTFLRLNDTPAAYAGQAGQYTRVNAGETALEFGLTLDDHSERHEWQGADELSLVRLLNQRRFITIDWQTIDQWTQTNTLTANQAIDIVACDLLTGATVNSIAQIRNTGNYIIIMRSSFGCHRYSVRNFGITQTASEIWMGVFRLTTTPSLTANHIGWRIVNGRIYASNGDSVNGTQTDTGDTDLNTVAWKTKRLSIMWDGTSDAQFYIDSTLVATHTTNLPVIAEGRIILQIKNTAGINQRFRWMSLSYVGDIHWG